MAGDARRENDDNQRDDNAAANERFFHETAIASQIP
jgi:hypothetical protein